MSAAWRCANSASSSAAISAAVRVTVLLGGRGDTWPLFCSGLELSFQTIGVCLLCALPELAT